MFKYFCALDRLKLINFKNEIVSDFKMYDLGQLNQVSNYNYRVISFE
jgi:hypothetical protein